MAIVHTVVCFATDVTDYLKVVLIVIRCQYELYVSCVKGSQQNVVLTSDKVLSKGAERL